MSLNESHVDSRWSQYLMNRARGEIQEAFEEFTLALQAGTIPIPPVALPQTPVYGGGVNYCPNSDLKFSKMAIETDGTLPGDAGDENWECYRFYRQRKTDNIVTDAAHALKGSVHSLYAANEGADQNIPVWDRENGFLFFGSDDDPIYDIAVHLYNNDITPARMWHLSFELGAITPDLVPDDLEMYCGIWQKSASGEGWIEGGNFVVSGDVVGVRGTKELNYLVVATTDGGNTLYSQILSITDAPDTLDTDAENPDNRTNFPRISYGDAESSGFTSFKIFREDVGSGRFYQIAHLQNTNYFDFDDLGGYVNMFPVQEFPAIGEEIKTAISYSRRLDIGANGAPLIINDFTIYIPDNYDWSATLPHSQFLRFGFTRTSAAPRQIRLDKIYLGPTFNKWSDSPLDPKDAVPSTSQTGGTPSTGGSTTPPGPGTGRCIRFDVPVLRLDFDRRREFVPYRDIPQGDLLVTGNSNTNIVLERRPRKNRLYARLYFSNGVTLYCNLPHRLRRNAGGDWITARGIKTGDSVWGYTRGAEGAVELLFKQLILVDEPEDFGTFALTGERGEGDHFYIAGFSRDGECGVFNINSKPDGVEIVV